MSLADCVRSTKALAVLAGRLDAKLASSPVFGEAPRELGLLVGLPGVLGLLVGVPGVLTRVPSPGAGSRDKLAEVGVVDLDGSLDPRPELPREPEDPAELGARPN